MKGLHIKENLIYRDSLNGGIEVWDSNEGKLYGLKGELKDTFINIYLNKVITTTSINKAYQELLNYNLIIVEAA